MVGINNKQKIICISEDMKKLKCLCGVGGNLKCTAAMETHVLYYGRSSKTELL